MPPSKFNRTNWRLYLPLRLPRFIAIDTLDQFQLGEPAVIFHLDAPSSSYSPLHMVHHHHSDHESSETAQIVVDLKKLGVDLDKEHGILFC